jgi:HNH endonuclease
MHPPQLRPARGTLQGDHIHAWAAGGTTSLDNGQLRCGYHNRWRWQHPDPEPPPEPDPGVDLDLRQRIAHLEQWRARLRATLVAEQAADA